MKNKIYALILFSSTLYLNTQAQCDGLTLTSQAEVDAFPSLGCTSISEILTISGSDITNLDSLYVLTRVSIDRCCTPWPSFNITDNPRLENIDGLSGLTHVGGVFAITNNPMLQNVDGLSSLTSIFSEFIVSNNASLTDLDGLSSLTHIGFNNGGGDGSLNINGNPSLTNIAGLRGVTNLPGDLEIVNNDALTDLDGLENITGGIGSLNVEGNASLLNIDGLASVTSLADFLNIEDNAVLPNLNGLRSLENLGARKLSRAFVTISNNPALTNVDSLARLRMNDSNKFLTVTNNPALTKGCGLFWLLHDSFVCGSCTMSITMEGNGPGITETGIRAANPCEEYYALPRTRH